MTTRTGPKAQDYSVVAGSISALCDLRISVGLREEWDAEGRVFDVSEAVRTAHAWMRHRVEEGQSPLSGMFPVQELLTPGGAVSCHRGQSDDGIVADGAR
jgi:hypothetical protein